MDDKETEEFFRRVVEMAEVAGIDLQKSVVEFVVEDGDVFLSVKGRS